MVKRAIINADDFGLCESNTLGIISAHKDGILTSATCMMGMPYAELALNLAKQYPDLGVGIHLTLTVGRPVLEGQKTFTDENGNFKKKKLYPGGQPLVDEQELYDEWKAQIEKFISIAGKKPTHIDSHHHVHMLPWLNPIAIRLAKEYDIPMRQRAHVLDTYEYVFVDERFYEEGVTYETLKEMLLDESREVVEVMNHVGFLDQPLYDMSSYNLPRMKELEIIKSQEIKDFVKEHNIELINFSHIKKM